MADRDKYEGGEERSRRARHEALRLDVAKTVLGHLVGATSEEYFGVGRNPKFGRDVAARAVAYADALLAELGVE